MENEIFVECPICGKIMIIGHAAHFWHCNKQHSVVSNRAAKNKERLVDGWGYPNWSGWAMEHLLKNKEKRLKK